MTPSRVARPSPLRSLLGVLPTGLALLAEGAWVAVVAALAQALAGQPAMLGSAALAVAAIAGFLAAREAAPRLGDRWPIAAIPLVGLVGAVGWLAAPAAREALAVGPSAAALAIHPGGWIAGLAFLRGTAHANRPVRGELDDPAGSLLAVGVVVIVVAFLVGGSLADPVRASFQAAAIPDTLVFVAASLVARSLARIAGVGGGFDWRRNPIWVGLLVALVAAILLVALPGSFAIGPLVLFVVAILPVPLLIAGLLSGVDRRGLRLIAGFAAVTVLVLVVVRLFGTAGGGPAEVGGTGVAPTTPDDQPWMVVAAWITGLVALVIAIGVLAALWMQAALRRGDDDVAEERVIDHGDEPAAGRRPWLRRPGRQRPAAPTDAVSAYRATLAELERASDLRRAPGETPAEHAARVRAGRSTRVQPVERGFGIALDLLAADYELARFGSRRLTAVENRRAVGRWRRVRAALRGRPDRGGRAGAPNREGPP